MKMTTGSLV